MKKIAKHTAVSRIRSMFLKPGICRLSSFTPWVNVNALPTLPVSSSAFPLLHWTHCTCNCSSNTPSYFLSQRFYLPWSCLKHFFLSPSPGSFFFPNVTFYLFIYLFYLYCGKCYLCSPGLPHRLLLAHPHPHPLPKGLHHPNVTF